MEMYAATRDAIKKKLHQFKARSLAPLTLLLDVWEDKVSGRKYLGTYRMGTPNGGMTGALSLSRH